MVTCTWLLPQAGTENAEICLWDGRGSKRTKISQVQSLVLPGIFKVEMVTLTSFLGVPSLLQNGGACWMWGWAALSLVVHFSRNFQMKKKEG